MVIRGRNLKARGHAAAQELGSRALERVAARVPRSAALAPAALSGLTAVAASPGYPSYLFSTADREIGWKTYRDSGFDEAKAAWVTERLAHVQRGTTVLDIGANIGTVGIPMVLRYGASRSVCFEPDPTNFRLLRCNAILNDVEESVVCINAALSNVNGALEFELSADNHGDHRVRAVDAGVPDLLHEASRQTITVQAMRLSTALEQADVEPRDVGLVWGDTQGHEGHVMAGAGALLGAVPWVVEYWPYGLRRAAGLDLFHHHAQQAFSTAIDVNASMAAGRDITYPTDDIARVDAALGACDHTDLLLLP